MSIPAIRHIAMICPLPMQILDGKLLASVDSRLQPRTHTLCENPSELVSVAPLGQAKRP